MTGGATRRVGEDPYAPGFSFISVCLACEFSVVTHNFLLKICANPAFAKSYYDFQRRPAASQSFAL